MRIIEAINRVAERWWRKFMNDRWMAVTDSLGNLDWKFGYIGMHWEGCFEHALLMCDGWNVRIVEAINRVGESLRLK